MAATSDLPVKGAAASAGLTPRLDRAVARLLAGIMIVCLAGLTCLVSFIVVTRIFALASAGWTDELIELLFAWLIFSGAALLWRDQGHFAVTLLADRARSGHLRARLALSVELASLSFLAAFTWYSTRLIITASEDSPVFAISRAWWYGALPVAGVIMMAYSIARVIGHLRRGLLARQD